MDVTGVVANSSGTLLGFDWDGIATINLTTDTTYVLGNTAAMTPKLYALDGASGNLLYTADLSIPMLPAQATLVY